MGATVYFGNSTKMLYYKTLKELQEEADKYGITIGDEVTIGDGSTIGNGVTIGDYSMISDNVDIGGFCTIGDFCYIGHCSKIGKNSTIADNITILTRAKIKAGWKIKDIVHLRNEYRYHVSGYRIDGTIVIQMGCFTRTLAEWENDFWNNNNEFRKGTPEGEQRLLAFNKIKKIMKG